MVQNIRAYLNPINMLALESITYSNQFLILTLCLGITITTILIQFGVGGGNSICIFRPHFAYMAILGDMFDLVGEAKQGLLV